MRMVKAAISMRILERKSRLESLTAGVVLATAGHTLPVGWSVCQLGAVR